MPISINDDIGPIIERRMPALLIRFPQHAEIINQLRADFFTTFGGRSIDELGQGSFCTVLNPWIATRVQDQDLARAIQTERIEIFGDLMRVLQPRFSTIPLRDIAPSLATNRNGTIPETPRRTSEQISVIAMQYASLAAFLGDAEALDILVMVGILSPGERANALSFIAPYLGESGGRPGGEGGGILSSDERILQNTTVFEKMRTSLVKFCYQKLMEEEADTLENQPETLMTIESWVSQQLDELYTRAFKGKAEKISTTHKDLYNSVVNHFKAAAALQIPNSMSKTTRDHNGREWPLGSWRQRLALVDMLNPAQRHTYIGIDAGGGKTFTYLWGFELAKEERRREKLPGRSRMLIFSTKAIISEIPNRVRQGSAPKETDALYYPEPDQAPTVGVIRAGMTPEQIREAASQDIVFCAYSMWRQTRTQEVDVDGETVREPFSIEDLLIDQSEPFTSITFDEAHLLQGDGERTRLARDTIHRIPNLYTQGHIVGGSGTPAPGHLNGLRVVLELFEPPRGPTQRNERKESPPNHWAELRRMLGKLWRMDKPEEWMEHVEMRGYPLSAEEIDLVQLIVEDNTIDAQSKLQMLLLIVRCPRLMSSNSRMPWTASEQTKLALSELLYGENRSSILVAENMRADGVLRPTKDEAVRAEQNPEDYFFQELQSWCAAQGIEFYVIHGGVKKEDERIAIYDQMRAAKQAGRKCVVYANSACLNLGIDLTDCCDGIVSQQWPYNTPDLYQLLKRVLRKGNTNCRMIVLAAQGTVEQGILTSAQHKYADVTRCLHGVTLSDERMAELSEKGLDPENEDVKRRIESSEQQWERFSRNLQGKGSAEIREFWNGYLDEFLVLLEKKESSLIGDDDRAIAGIVHSLEEAGLLTEAGNYLHTSSFGQRLRDHLLRVAPDFRRSVRSMDATQEMLDYGGINLPAVSGNIVATPAELYRKVLDDEVSQGSQDFVVLQGFEQTSHAQSESLQRTGRLRALRGAVLSLKPPDTARNNGGILMIPLPFEACTREQMNTLKDQLIAFGLEVLPGYTGSVTSQDNEGEPGHRMYVITAKKVLEFDASLLSSIQSSSFVLSPTAQKSAHVKYKHRKLPFSLPHTHFKIGRKDVSLPIHLPERDKKLRYLERLTHAVESIRSIASSSTELIAKLDDAETQILFATLGVICFPHLHMHGAGARRPSAQERVPRRLAFRFDKAPLFYPFDKQWAERLTPDSE